MYEEEIQNQQQEAESSAQAAQQTPSQEENRESIQAKNFRALKDRLDRIERERDEAIRRAHETEARYRQPEPKEDDDFGGSNDDLVDIKLLKKGFERERKRMTEEFKKQQQQLESKLAEDRLRIMYPDVDTVLSADNIDALQSIEPELARTIGSSGDNYGKAVSAYKLIKKLGIYKDPQESAHIQKNLAKPRPASSVGAHQGDTPLSKAHEYGERLTEDRKKQLWREMQESMR